MRPLIIYVPGLLPKPEASLHRDALFRCLIQGVSRVNADVAQQIVATPGSFDIVSWTFDFYGEHRDFSLDAAAIDAVIEQECATAADIAEASSWRRRLMCWIYNLGDRLPVLIPHIASDRMQMHLRDLRRYVNDDNGIAEHTRQMLKVALRAASESRRPILLIAHSMGSVIAYDSLWQMSRVQRDHVIIDRLLTMGSPLGQHYMQTRIQGHDETGTGRYPTNVRRWTNLSALGDLTAIDPVLRDDFKEMVDLNLVEELHDMKLTNYFRLDGELNVHAEYGYLVNHVTARVIVDWWIEQQHQSATTAD